VKGLDRITSRMEVEPLVAAFAREVERGEQWKGPPGEGPLAVNLPVSLAGAIDGKVGPQHAHEYGKLLSRAPELYGRAYMRAAVVHLDAETAWPLVAPLLTPQYGEVLGFRRAEDLPLILLVLEKGDPNLRQSVLNRLGNSLAGQQQQPDPAYARAVAKAVPDVVRWLPQHPGLLHDLPFLIRSLPAAELHETAVTMLRSVLQQHPGLEGDAINSCFSVPRSLAWTYVARVTVPCLPRIWEILSAGGRQSLLYHATNLLNAQQAGLGEEATRELEAFVRAHLPEMTNYGAYQILIRFKDRFPPAEWIPHAPEAMWSANGYDVPDPNAAARALKHVNRSALHFVRRQASVPVQREILERLYPEADAARIHDLLDYTTKENAPPEALARALGRLLADEAASLDDLGRLGALVAELSPSEALFPLVERLLASGRSETIRTGIRLARSLGREEMVPKLLGLLDSMDRQIRTEAKEAIDSILELRRIKDEVQHRVGR
jgi:hypothetical protein